MRNSAIATCGGAHLAHLPFDRRTEAQVVEECGAQLLDDAPLERYAGVERLLGARESARDLGALVLEPVLDP